MTLRVSVPIPSILAPMATRQLARSPTSGSLAALEICVSPSAKVAAIITFSVAPTETEGNKILAPLRPFFACALI